MDRCSVALQLPIRFDVKKLQEDLSKVENSLWSSHVEEGGLYTQGWKEIALVSREGKFENLWNDRDWEQGPFEKTPLLKTCSYFDEILNYFQAPKKLCRLLQLEAGAEIFEHTDHEGYFRDTVRFHIPVRTHPDIRFTIKNRPLTMKEGEVWYTNTLQVHSVKNPSSVNRVHLVIDCTINPFIRKLFKDLVGEPGFWMQEVKRKVRWYRLSALAWKVSKKRVFVGNPA